MILPFILSLLPLIHRDAPTTGHVKSLSQAIAYTVDHDELPVGWTRERTAAVLLVSAWEESRFHMEKVGIGSSGKSSYCAFQIQGAPSLANDVLACTHLALSYIRKSVEICPTAPLAPFIGGCNVPQAQRRSFARLWKVDSIMAHDGGV